MATLLVTTRKARELGRRPEIEIELVAKSSADRPGLMPEARPGGRLLDRALAMKEIAVVKSHNPFALNDAIFSKLLETTGAG
jgi:hypothetical protein